MSRVPLERALSKLGLASRTEARKLIESGKVKVHGKLQTNPLFPVTPETAAISIEGLAQAKQNQVLVAFHKPKGVITTKSDEKNRKTVFECLPTPLRAIKGLHTVGRLDLATTGLLLLTNDTRLSAWLTDPKNEIPRTYHVSVRGKVSSDTLVRMQKGVTSEVGHLSALQAQLRKSSEKESHLILTLDEGKNREIRRLCEALGHEVTALKRLSYGTLELGDLKPGDTREISAQELESAFPGHPRSSTLRAPTPK